MNYDNEYKKFGIEPNLPPVKESAEEFAVKNFKRCTILRDTSITYSSSSSSPIAAQQPDKLVSQA